MQGDFTLQIHSKSDTFSTFKLLSVSEDVQLLCKTVSASQGPRTSWQTQLFAPPKLFFAGASRPTSSLHGPEPFVRDPRDPWEDPRLPGIRNFLSVPLDVAFVWPNTRWNFGEFGELLLHGSTAPETQFRICPSCIFMIF